jgi:predicted dehydrogenase
MPALARRTEIAAVATRTGVSARATAQRFDARLATTDPRALIEDDTLDAIVIATRHDTHAQYAQDALHAGKHVFVEKPLALNETELAGLEAAVAESERVLMVGFNRRFAPLAVRMREALGDRGPLMVAYRVNAGRLPRAHWTHDPEAGGGRIVGEVCHFVDFAGFLCGGAPVALEAAAAVPSSEPLEDDVTATMRHPDGSVSVVVYTALGDPSLPKERVEVQGEAGAGVLDDFRVLSLHRGGQREEIAGNRDKGHVAEIEAFIDGCRQGAQPWPVEDMLAVTRMTFAIRDAICAAS